MAKRTRGVSSTSAYRPGRTPTAAKTASLPSTSSSPRPGTQPPAAIPGAAPRPSELEASVVLTEDVTADAPTAATSTVRSHQRGHVKIKPGSALAARAAQEYVYVGEDLRNITKVGITLAVVMIVLWLLIVVGNVFGLY
ncbi:MAG: hypothetical protein KF809_04420 [Chloroflexi bacterium]|nr:hypothetical protein [Chloroflexota bacterium]